MAALTHGHTRATGAAPSLLLRGGLLVDGTGAPPRAADVRVRGDRIAEVAPSLEAAPGERVLDVSGLVVAPGFVDAHSHVDRQIFALRADSQVAQGIATAIVGVDGAGPYPVGAFLDRLAASPAAINVAAMVGHGAVRRAVMGDARRPASAEEVRAMRARVARAFAEGAIGLSSGLEYDPGYHAAAGELSALAAEAAAAGGVYATHLRDEGDAVLDALAEAMDVGRAAGAAVHVSHLKLGATARGRAAAALQALRTPGVDATADWYPYTFWVTTTASLAPPRRAGSRAHWSRVIGDAGGPARLTITSFAADRSYEGRTVADVAAERGASAEDVLLDLERRGHAGLAAQAMEERDLETIVRDPRVMVASDGGIRIAHPRGAGAFPRVLRRYVRERGLLTLEAAIHKMTGMPARRFGLSDRGRIAPGLAADLVVFDADTVADRATAMEPQRAPAGIHHVFVNGVAVVSDGRPTAARPGRPLRGIPLFPGDVRHGQAGHGDAVAEVGLADLRQVVRRDPGVPRVVGMDGDGDPAAAVLEAARAAHDHAAAEPALPHHRLQPLVERDRALRRAGALRVFRRALVDADQHVSLGLGHRPPPWPSIVGWRQEDRE
jgi:N-acyl-D-amino-acid deacylase